MERDQYTAAIQTVERMRKIIEGDDPDWTTVMNMATDLALIANDPEYVDDGEDGY